MKKSQCIRQGDVLIVPIFEESPIPEGSKEVGLSKMGPILALGEVTGHHHTVVADPEAYRPEKDLPHEFEPKLGMTLAEYASKQLKDLEVERLEAVTKGEPAAKLFQPPGGNEGLRFLEITRPTVLRHDEHGAIPLTVGYYKIIRQQEKRPEGWRNVAD